MEQVDTVVVGGGQAGVAMSEHLGRLGINHVVLERSRIAERWRTARWDSLVANGPAWHDRFPGMEFPDHEPGDFVPKESVADYLEAYAKMVNAPIRCGVDVKSVRKNESARGFIVETDGDPIAAHQIVAATGAFQKPVIPELIPSDAGVMQIHSTGYRNPGQMPEGAVLVIGAGSSGAQIAEELMESGRDVYLSVGPHDRPPRRYRGRDFCWWLGVLGKWDAQTPGPGTEHVTIAVSGAHGGRTVDFRRFAASGMTLLGRSVGYADGTLEIADDLRENVTNGDQNLASLLNEADDFVTRNGLDLPDDPEARKTWPEPACLSDPVRSLNLADANIQSVIWATGFSQDYGWLQVDVFDAQGKPEHRRGITEEMGVYFLGLPWQSRRGSSFLWGVWHDAKFIADQIAIQHQYYDHLHAEPAIESD